MDQLGESIRKLILAGIGAAAVTKEKSESILRDLVKKGELTVEQGKVLNEELKHSVKEAIRDNVTVHVVRPEEDLDNLDDAQLEALRQRVQAAQEKRAQAAPETGSDWSLAMTAGSVVYRSSSERTPRARASRSRSARACMAKRSSSAT